MILLDKYKITQEEAAKIMEVSQSTISRWCDKVAPLKKIDAYHYLVLRKVLEDFYGEEK